MLNIFLSVAALVLILAGIIIILLAMRALTTDAMARRLQQYVALQPAANPTPTELSGVRKSELAGSFRERVVLPGFRRVAGVFGRFTPASSLESLEKQLAIAGRPLGLGPREFYGLRIIFSLLGIWLAFLILRQELTLNRMTMALLVLYIGLFLPRVWLSRRVRQRQDRIRKGLPDALDMLSVCVDAGLGFDQALLRVSEYWKTPVGIEFGRVVAEMEMGVPRAQALRNLSERLDVLELSSFVAVIIQSDQLGMSIADTLRSQAQQMRIERRFRAQEQARKVPLKMLFPMLLLIFPAMLAVICGPVIPILVRFFATLRSAGGP